MYDRKINDKILDFEASGALYHSALVMQDNQTDSFWAMMTSTAIGGPQQGSKLVELPISTKTTWGEWKKRHPHTLLLNVDGDVHIQNNHYDNYFTSDRLFGEMSFQDKRLPPKTSIFAFNDGHSDVAVTHKAAESGLVARVADKPAFFYRPKDASLFRSTVAWHLEHKGKPIELKQVEGKWQSSEFGVLNEADGRFAKSDLQLKAISGMDTFWYIWSQYHRKILLPEQDDAN